MRDARLQFDAPRFDSSTTASEDFYQYVNGSWLNANPVPPEYGAWGAFHEVNQRNEQLLHRLLKQVASSDAANGTTGRLVGDYFAAAMDVGAIAAAGVGPLAPWLSRIGAAESVADASSRSNLAR